MPGRKARARARESATLQLMTPIFLPITHHCLRCRFLPVTHHPSPITASARPRPTPPLRFDQRLDRIEQLIFLIRLAEVIVDAQFDGACAMLLADARGDHDD